MTVEITVCPVKNHLGRREFGSEAVEAEATTKVRGWRTDGKETKNGRKRRKRRAEKVPFCSF